MDEGSKTYAAESTEGDLMEKVLEEYSYENQQTSQGGHLGFGVVMGLFAVIILVAVWTLVGVLKAQTIDQGAISLRDTVLNASMQCFAIEGAYPPTLQYLEDNYGVVVNTRSYIVRYEVYATNELPSVVVVPREN